MIWSATRDTCLESIEYCTSLIPKEYGFGRVTLNSDFLEQTKGITLIHVGIGNEGIIICCSNKFHLQVSIGLSQGL